VLRGSPGLALLGPGKALREAGGLFGLLPQPALLALQQLVER
jgi:hypothetical protein